MGHIRHHTILAAIGLLLGLVITGCGGGGGDGGGSTTSLTPETQVIFSDSFSDGDDWSTRWELQNDTANVEAWEELNGKLLQSGFLETGALDPSTSYHIGSFAYLDPSNPPVDSFPDDYRIRVDVTPLTNDVGDSDGNDVGIMFRYLNPNNYYRLTMSSKFGFTRLEKRVGGAFRTLAINAIGYVDNQPMTLMAEVNGSNIIVWIDGDPVFAVVDSSIASGTVALFAQDQVAFDNVRITETPDDPLVAITTPLAYSVRPGDPVDLTVAAVALNVPSGGSVEFSLDGDTQSATSSLGDFYSATFENVGAGEHEVTAAIIYANGSQADIDINSTVGTGGDYYIALGDSITNGVGDEDPSNNDSEDGRIVSMQGFQAELADLLTDDLGLPQIVFNEGIEGDEAGDLYARLDSILERHPRANKVLVLIGTNDSGGTSTSAGDFEDDVQAIADEVEADGKSVWIAEILPVDGNATRNTIIQNYNTRIQAIASADGGDSIFLGPDLYSAFDGRSDLYTGSLHPNDAGFSVMANEWVNVLP